MLVAIQQSAIPHYAVPLFEGIAAAPDITLIVTFDEAGPSGLPSRPPLGVEARAARVRALAASGLYWADAQWSLAARGACDVLVLEWNARYLSLVPAILRARRNGIPTLLWGHGYSKRPSRLRDGLRAIPARLADGLLLYESVTAATWASRRWRPRLVAHANNSLDDRAIASASASWRTNPAALEAFRNEHDLTPGRTLLFIGRLYADNDLDFLLDAFRLVLDACPDARLVVVGEDATERPRLTARAARLGMAPAVRWTGALYDEAAIAPWALASTLFVYPKNIGLGLVHAMNHALPVIVSGERSHHNPEIHALEDDVNGLLVTDPSPAAYARAIVELLQDPERQARLASGARATIDTRFNMQTMVEQFVTALRAIAGREAA